MAYAGQNVLFVVLALAPSACGYPNLPRIDERLDAAIDSSGGIDAEIDGGGTTDGAIDAPPAGATCNDYCNAITNNCAGTNVMYSSATTCVAACSLFPLGSMGAQTGNTLECRQLHAQLAASAPATHCAHAGPGGAGVCGADCEGYCTLVMGACTGANAQYTSMVSCMNSCSSFSTSPPYSAGVSSGNSLACRLYFATIAIQQPAVHCPHVAPTSTTCQ